jgi:hypothetical protein
MKVNLLCDKFGMERKNLKIHIEPDVMQQVQNPSSKYTGVSWNKNRKNWETKLMYNKQHYYGGNFDNEEKAAMKVNLLCDKLGIERKNPNLKLDKIQQARNLTSHHPGVSWIEDSKKWQAELLHDKKKYYGGLFDNEEDAACNQ